MTDYPKLITRLNHVEPVPRRIRAVHGGRVMVDTVAARYVWEWANYPQYYVPRRTWWRICWSPMAGPRTPPGGRSSGIGWPRPVSTARRRPDSWCRSDHPRLIDTFRFDWDALDHWFEEDEEVFVHPRNPYCRVDALRSARPVRVALDGVVLAESASPVMVFETGLPTRYYLNRTEVHFEHLVPTTTVTRCPYKGTTTGYWSVVVDGATHADLAWSYDFPTRQLLPIAGLVAFYNEKVDTYVDDELLERPRTHFSD